MVCVPLLTALALDRHRCFALCLRKVVSQGSLAGRPQPHPRATDWVLRAGLGPKPGRAWWPMGLLRRSAVRIYYPRSGGRSTVPKVLPAGRSAERLEGFATGLSA